LIETLPADVAELWPYEPRWTKVGGYHLHHIDEGPAGSPDAVVLLAGNPTWGFLYRDIIPPILDAGFRVLALDYLGMGRSDHARREEEYAIQHHADRVRAQLRGAGVERAVFFMQDWAGPIGLTAALDRPGLLAGMVLANTFWGEQSEFQKNALGWRSLHAPVSGALLLGKRRMFTSALRLSGPRSIHDGAAWKAYNLPFDAHTSPGSTYAFPRAISTGPGHPTHELARRIYDAMATEVFDIPTRFVWGDSDAVFTREEQEATFRARLPRGEEHPTVVVPGGRHFVQEYGPQQCADATIAVAQEAFG
jgi:pimeloyl-ACP methyl ester carboxylesterase